MFRSLLLAVLVVASALGCCPGGLVAQKHGLHTGSRRRGGTAAWCSPLAGLVGVGLIPIRPAVGDLAFCRWPGRLLFGDRGRRSVGLRAPGAASSWRAASRDRAEKDRVAEEQLALAQELPKIFDVRFDGSQQRQVVWDGKSRKFVGRSETVLQASGSGTATLIVQNEYTPVEDTISSPLRRTINKVGERLRVAFLPWGVTNDYYAFTLWRIAQRIVSSTVSVFGTQSLLLALGVKTNKAGAAAAAGWIWANAFGKFGKMAFAAKWGRKFDSDAKRWRFRSALMWVFANGMEITTFVAQGFFPVGFIFIVALSVSLKQISILTSSATRGTFYKQFAGNNENLGDITAKGDAQVAVADLIGMVIGIELARLAGTNALAVWGCYGVLSSLDFWFILKSLDMIVFRFLNLERSFMCAYHYVNDPERAVPTPEELSKQEPVVNRPKRAVRQSYWSDLTKGYWSGTFRGISQTPLTPSRLAGLLEVFSGDQYIIVPRRKKCAVLVLRQSASDVHVLEALLALERFETQVPRTKPRRTSGQGTPMELEEAKALELVREARDWAAAQKPDFIKKAQAAKWAFKDASEPVLNYGYIAQRAIW